MFKKFVIGITGKDQDFNFIKIWMSYLTHHGFHINSYTEEINVVLREYNAITVVTTVFPGYCQRSVIFNNREDYISFILTFGYV